MQVIFPKLSTIAYADTIIKNCTDVQKTRDISTFVFEKTTFIDPFAITVIAGAIQSCLRTKNKKIAYIPPEDKKLKDYLSQIGFNSFFHINGKNIHKDTSVELTQLMALHPFYIERLIILIESKMSLSKDELTRTLNQCI
jgi:hypothetical protein